MSRRAGGRLVEEDRKRMERDTEYERDDEDEWNEDLLTTRALGIHRDGNISIETAAFPLCLPTVESATAGQGRTLRTTAHCDESAPYGRLHAAPIGRGSRR